MSSQPTLAPVPPEPDDSVCRRRLSSEDRRRQLLRHAVDLFARHGFSGTRTKDIAAACGVSEGILFRHFSTKEDLYRAILDAHQDEQGSAEWLQEMRVLAERRDDEGFLRCLIEQILKSFRDNASFHRLLMFASLDGHALADLFHEQLGKPTFEFLRDYISLRQREGAFAKYDPGAAVLFAISGVVQYALGKHVMGREVFELDDEDLTNQLSHFVLQGLQAGPPLNASGKRKTKPKPRGARP
jgi:TetR/AcrR family transcriptional regulator